MIDCCEDSKEKKQLQTILDKIVKIVTQLNEDQRLTENRELLLEIVSKFADKNDKVWLPPLQLGGPMLRFKKIIVRKNIARVDGENLPTTWFPE